MMRDEERRPPPPPPPDVDESIITTIERGMPTCMLCGQTVLGYGTAMSGTTTVPLCHSSARDCYHRWTVWDQRPGNKPVEGKVGAER